METQLTMIEEIIKELKSGNFNGDHSLLRLDVQLEFERINDALMQIWANKPKDLEAILGHHLTRTFQLIAKFSNADVGQGDFMGVANEEDPEMLETNQCIFNGLLGLFSRIQLLESGDEEDIYLKNT